jgi:hypothetical protein
MATFLLPPARRTLAIETAFVAITVVAVLVGAVVFAWVRGTGGNDLPPLLAWQVSAFADLGADDQAMHSSLMAAADEIASLNFDFGDWPQPAELAKLEIPPFVQDDFWDEHGKVAWSQLNAADFVRGGDTVYMGTGAANPAQSAYLLVFRHRHMGAGYSNQREIWIHKDVAVGPPDGTRAESLTLAGWKQVVSFSGADEVARTKGR